ncbi:MAG: hypothetical protein IPG45_37105 [Deltaproteobacteria bacterium]|nr:hypothetical protein [Deltaproteobacteria bacterium]
MSPSLQRRRLGRALLALGLCVGPAALLACRGDTTLTLPDRPEAEVVFSVFYEQAKVVAIGSVVPAAVLYSGGYSVTAEASGLEARVFFLKAKDLTEAAQDACAQVEDGPSRLACLAPTTNCEAEPASCLGVARIDEGCGDRAPLLESVMLQTYAATDGRLAATSGGADGTILCGPVVRPPCPIVAPGLVVTAADGFRCVAPVNQLGCELKVDLSRCGFDALEATLDASGGLSTPRGPCQPVPLPEGNGLFGNGPYFALDCGAGTLVASTMGTYLGETGCPRHGPGVFYGRTPFALYPGLITGVLPIEVTGRAPQLLISGAGLDECRATGCSLDGIDCSTECTRLCTSYNIDQCAANEWATCTGAVLTEACTTACTDTCERSINGECGITSGPALALTSALSPEADSARLRLDDVADGSQALAYASGQQQVWVAAGNQAVLANLADPLSQVGALALGFLSAGLLPGDDGSAYFFGSSGTEGRLLRINLTGSDPPLSADPVIALPELRQIDQAAWFNRDTLAVFDRRAPSPALWLIPVGGGAATAVGLTGTPTAIVALPGGGVVLGIRSPSGPHQLVRVLPDPFTLAQVSAFSLIPGLEPTALALDPLTCASPSGSGCRVLIGLARSERPGPPLVGAALSIGTGFFVTPSLLEVSMISIDQLVTSSDTVFAISSRHNGITPIHLAR